jgi:hypothetical protein
MLQNTILINSEKQAPSIGSYSEMAEILGNYSQHMRHKKGRFRAALEDKSQLNQLAGGLGFEPRLAESESAVLPLDDPPSVGLDRRDRSACGDTITRYHTGAPLCRGRARLYGSRRHGCRRRARSARLALLKARAGRPLAIADFVIPFLSDMMPPPL